MLESDTRAARRRGRGHANVSVLDGGASSMRLAVEAPSPALVLVKIPFDPDWRASVDGEDVPVEPADYLMQAVPVPGGRHTVSLRYDDPWLGYGLLGSAVSVAALLGAALAAHRLRKRIAHGRRQAISATSGASPW